MPDAAVSTSTGTNQLPPRTHISHRWPRKWATLGGRGAPSTTIPPLEEIEAHGKTNGHHANGNGHRHSTSLFRKSSTISRTTAPRMTNPETPGNDNNSLKKSRSLINVLRSKLNSPAVLRRFRTKSRENTKQVVTEVVEPTSIPEETNKKHRKRDPSPMQRLTNRLAQLTRSSTHNTITPDQVPEDSPTKTDQDQVDRINICYDEIRAKYFDQPIKSNTTSLLTQSSSIAATERLKEILSTTTTSSIDYYDRPNLANSENPNRSLSTISINGSLLSHDLLNNSQQNVPSASPPLKPRTPDDPLLVARKQSNIKLNCMLSGYVSKNPFANSERLFGQSDIFKFHHYHDVGKRKFDWNITNDNNRLYSSMRVRPMSRSIDSFRRATTTVQTDLLPTERPTVNDHLLVTDETASPVPSDSPLVIREDGDPIESEPKTYTSKIHIQPAVPVQVRTFISSTSPSKPILNGKDNEFERNFLRAVDRALGLTNADINHLLQPIYDTPINKEICLEDEKASDDDQLVNGNESPNVELFDRTGEVFLDNDPQHWQSSAVYDDQRASEMNGHHRIESNGWSSLVDNLTQKTQDFLSNELKNGQEFLVTLDGEEKFIKGKADAYERVLSSNDQRLSEEVQSDIQVTIGEVNLLIRGKLKQFRGLCQANISKSVTSAGEPTPLDSDLAGFWDITKPLIEKVKQKFVKLDACQARAWAIDADEFDPDDVTHRPRKAAPIKSKISSTSKSANGDLKKLIEERRKAANSNTNQNDKVEIFHSKK